MATAVRRSKTPPAVSGRATLDVHLGASASRVGTLVFQTDGRRRYSQFAYDPEWLASSQAFDLSPDLKRLPGWQTRKGNSAFDSSFFFALADTEPDAWGRRVIARAHARRRGEERSLGALTELDYLTAVDDTSRIGGLRLRVGWR